jgi:hypothetical protein
MLHLAGATRTLITYTGTFIILFRCISRTTYWHNSHSKVNGRGKVHPTAGHEDPEGRKKRYRSTLSLTSALDGCGWSTPRPSRFTPRKDPVPIVQVAGWVPGPGLDGRKISPPPGFDPRIVQPIAGRYTDWAIPVLVFLISGFIPKFTLRQFPANPRQFTAHYRYIILPFDTAVTLLVLLTDWANMEEVHKYRNKDKYVFPGACESKHEN